MSKNALNIKKIEEVLTRGVQSIYPSKETLESLLLSGKKIKIYAGLDPTAPSSHLGHQILIKKLAQFQELGHIDVFLVGDFTAMIGDPTDKKAARKKLTKKEVLNNLKDYKKQAQRILKFSGQGSAKIMFNSSWLDKLGTGGILELASCFTAQQMLARDMFQERVQQKKPIYLNEFLYPVLQAYDSVAMDIDLEIGGNDQTFNMLCGRSLMKEMKNKEKFVLTMKLLTDSNGKKMGKTDSNSVSLMDSAKEMFGKVMSWDDSMIVSALELLSNVSIDEILELDGKMKNGQVNPRNGKALLAREIVALNWGKEKAQEAQEEFDSIFKEKNQPKDILEVKIQKKELNVLDFLLETKLVFSKNEAKRLIDQGGVKIDNETQLDLKKNIQIKKGQIVQIGKRIFAKII